MVHIEMVNKKKLMTTAIAILICGAALILITGCGWYRQFGNNPKGADLEVVKASPHYAGDRFTNLEETPHFTDGSTPMEAFVEMMTTSVERGVPDEELPAVKPDFRALPPDKDLVVWLGHLSFYIQLGGYSILVDPIFNDHASPLPWFNKAFPGTNIFAASDFPKIDYLLITHDQWDHLDYQTALTLRPVVENVICGLGVGSHFRYWGYPETAVWEADWNTSLHVADDLTIHVLTARHASGRFIKRDPTLWVSFALETPERKIFISGDSGYGKHFAKIGERFDGFDLAILDSGQYNEKWRHIHMNPEESAKAAEDLRAEALLPAHVGRFCLARHSWDDPFIRAHAAGQGKSYRLLTPVIGEVVELDNDQQKFSRWWEGLP